MTTNLVHIPGVTEETVRGLDVEIVYDPEVGNVGTGPHVPQETEPYELVEVRGVQVPVPISKLPELLQALEEDRQSREDRIKYRPGGFSRIDDQTIFVETMNMPKPAFDRVFEKMRKGKLF